MAGGMPPIKGRKAAVKYWTSMLLKEQSQLDEFCDCINDRTYSMTSGKGGQKVQVAIKKAKIDWSRQAVVVIVSEAPFQKHALQIERSGNKRYSAIAIKVENSRMSAPSGLGAFDAFVFPLAPGEKAADIQLVMAGTGAGEDGVTPLPSSPQWHTD